MSVTDENLVQLYERLSALAEARLRELFGDQWFEAFAAAPGAQGLLYVNLAEREISIAVKWPTKLGPAPRKVLSYCVPEAAEGSQRNDG